LSLRRPGPAALVLLAGISAALHVGKLPTAIPVLREALDMTLVEAGFLLSLVQLAGMTLGIAVGLAADSQGLKRTMVTGLLLLSLASLLGGWAQSASTLMLLRAVEGMGFLLASMPAPSLISRVVAPPRVDAALGLWGAYMPFGTAVALVAGPFAIAAMEWRGWWWFLALLSGVMGLWVWQQLPADRPVQGPGSFSAPWPLRLRQTLSAPGPWLVALTFAMYSGQWLAVIGFLPSVLASAGFSATSAGAATALVAAVNIVGNVAAGRLLQRGMPPQSLLYLGFATMALGAFVAYAPVLGWLPAGGSTALRYGAIVAFSMVGGLVPGTLFVLAVRLAPGSGTVSTTVGWLQQCSSIGQFFGPPAVAWVASLTGGWEWSWTVTAGCAAMGAGLAWFTGRLSPRQPPRAAPT
jgi:CP family cyanate transporter-like MFS transporter